MNEHIGDVRSLLGVLWHHVLVSIGLHVDYFDVFFIYYFRYSVIEPIGDD